MKAVTFVLSDRAFDRLCDLAIRAGRNPDWQASLMLSALLGDRGQLAQPPVVPDPTPELLSQLEAASSSVAKDHWN